MAQNKSTDLLGSSHDDQTLWVGDILRRVFPDPDSATLRSAIEDGRAGIICILYLKRDGRVILQSDGKKLFLIIFIYVMKTTPPCDRNFRSNHLIYT